MAATVGIHECTGGSYTPGSSGTDKRNGSIIFRSNDSAATDSANPVSLSSRSYEKWLHLRATGTFTSLSNFRVYASGSAPATGVTYYIRTTNPAAYAAPAVPANDAAGTDFTNYTSGSPKSLTVQNAGPWTTTGDVADFFVLWASVGGGASAGAMGGPACVYGWDEV